MIDDPRSDAAARKADRKQTMAYPRLEEVVQFELVDAELHISCYLSRAEVVQFLTQTVREP